jgi:hypothetical protein
MYIYLDIRSPLIFPIMSPYISSTDADAIKLLDAHRLCSPVLFLYCTFSHVFLFEFVREKFMFELLK